MKTKSLTRRVSLTAFASVITIGLVLITILALSIGPASQRALVEQMKTQAETALNLDGQLSVEQIAETIARPGTAVTITENEVHESAEAVFVSVDSETDVATVEVFLPKSEASLVLTASNQQASSVSMLVLGIGLPSIVVLALLIWLVLGFAMRRAMRPLGEMTALAVDIASGQRGVRLEISEPENDLGVTGIALNKMLDNLEGALNMAEDARQSIRQMSLDVAHELKTPLATIVSSAENSMRSASEENQKQLVTVIREARRAGRIIGTLTQLQAIEEGGRAETFPVTFDISRLLRELASDLPEVELELGKKEIMAFADEHQVGQILRNLLENALIHKTKRVVLELTGSAETVTVRVSDDGPGVIEADRTRVFDRFVRLDYSRSRNKGGSGLGLAISKALAHANGAELWCEESDLGGARFVLKLNSRP